MGLLVSRRFWVWTPKPHMVLITACRTGRRGRQGEMRREWASWRLLFRSWRIRLGISQSGGSCFTSVALVCINEDVLAGKKRVQTFDVTQEACRFRTTAGSSTASASQELDIPGVYPGENEMHNNMILLLLQVSVFTFSRKYWLKATLSLAGFPEVMLISLLCCSF